MSCSIWVSIVDNEAHYLMVLMEGIFGRITFVAKVLCQKSTSPDARLHLGAAHDHLLVYATDPAQVTFNHLKLSAEQHSNYKNPDKDSRGPWTSTDFTAQGWRPNQMYKITTPGGTEYDPPEGRCWGNIESAYMKLKEDNRLWVWKRWERPPKDKKFLVRVRGDKLLDVVDERRGRPQPRGEKGDHRTIWS